MKTLQFTKEIKAPAQKVWDTLWNDATYTQWTSAFNPRMLTAVLYKVIGR